MEPIKLTIKDRALLTDPVKRQHWIQYQLKMRGSSMAAVARQHGTKPDCLRQVWRKTYPKAEKRIADALGLHPADLWPERYDKDGLPIYRGGPKHRPENTLNAGEQP